jgi:hypothetical protein
MTNSFISGLRVISYRRSKYQSILHRRHHQRIQQSMRHRWLVYWRQGLGQSIARASGVFLPHLNGCPDRRCCQGNTGNCSNHCCWCQLVRCENETHVWELLNTHAIIWRVPRWYSLCSYISTASALWSLSIQNQTNKQTNSVALSPQAKYTDSATDTCRRNLVPTFVDRGVSRGQRGGTLTVVNLSFLDRSRYFSFK